MINGKDKVCKIVIVDGHGMMIISEQPTIHL